MMKEDWRPRPWGVLHQWVGAQAPEAASPKPSSGFPKSSRGALCPHRVPGPSAGLGKERCLGVAHEGGMGSWENV